MNSDTFITYVFMLGALYLLAPFLFNLALSITEDWMRAWRKFKERVDKKD